MKWKYIVAWFPGILIGIINGSLRQFIYLNYLHEHYANQLSVLSFIILFGIYVWSIIPWLKINTNTQALYVGSLWICLTILFEFVFGHYIMSHPWEKLLYEYNLLAGRLWILVLIWIFISPWVIYKSVFK